MHYNENDLPEFNDDFDEPTNKDMFPDGQRSNEYLDESGDKKYFAQIPEMVMAMTDPYEYRLWAVIKMITGERGKCVAGANLLARLAGMSVGKVSQCRKSLHEKKLLRAKREILTGNTSRIIVIIPDLWEENIKWRKKAGNALHHRAEIYENSRTKAVKPKKTRK